MAAIRAILTACATYDTPTNALGFTFYAVAAIVYSEVGLFESKQKAQKGEIIHGFIGCRCTEWYRG